MDADRKAVIVLSRELPEMFTQALARLADVRVYRKESGEDVFESATVYLAAGIDTVPAGMIESFPPGLGLIANIATGTDNIDLEAAASRGIEVSNTPVVAEDTFVETEGRVVGIHSSIGESLNANFRKRFSDSSYKI